MADVFVDVENRPLDAGTPAGTGSVESGQMAIGKGSKVFRADQSGIWLGAEQFTDAPFSVDMLGNVVASSADFSGSGYTKINIFKQTGIPTSIAVGDLWFDTDDGNKLYRAGAIGATTIAEGQWEAVQDATIADAQSTADSKINVFAQDAIPTSIAVGDIWYDTNDSNKPYRAASVGADAITAEEWVLVNDLRAADALLKAGTAQVLSGDFGVGSSSVKIDGANGRIVINDGSDDRIVIGNV